MPIEYLPEKNAFFVHSLNTTYALAATDFGALAHLYWGPSVATQDLTYRLATHGRPFSHQPAGTQEPFSLDTLPQEFPACGTSDFRAPAIEIFDPATGSRIVDLRYDSHQIADGKPSLEGLPATYAQGSEAATLTISLQDEATGLVAQLLYTAFANHPVMARSVRLANHGPQAIDLRRLLSASVDFTPAHGAYHFIQLSGTWARERDVFASPLRPGMQSVESRRGSSGHHHNPFIALAQKGCDEEDGQVFGFNLVYSANFLALAEVDSDGAPRVQIGINPFDFSWRLEPGESFQAPETIMAFSATGLGGLSRAFHRFYREHLGISTWRRRPRPIVVNNWEATEFDFDADKLERFAVDAAELGAEVLVLDDGWFGHRDAPTSSLGDWVADKRKLPGGLEDLAAKINAQGLTFGLWFEPEMVSPDSGLFRAHPDWCIHVPSRARTLGRGQYILDFSRAEVRDAIYQQMARLLRTVPIAFIKWDMNRNMTETGSAALPAHRQAETAHRNILGVYAFLDQLLGEFPDVLIEGCSGGGGRFDPGMLHYMPQIWTSDNTDAISRLRIQYGTSLAYPLEAISAHVSEVPNKQVGRVTPISTRAHAAFTGAFGYELDPSALSPRDKSLVKEQVQAFKQLRELLLDGDLYRLRSPFTGNEAAWIVVSPDKRQALATHVQILSQPNPGRQFLALRGLDPNLAYRIEESGEVWRGDALMHAGLPLQRVRSDFFSRQWRLCAV